jgi:hypothetical protein
MLLRIREKIRETRWLTVRGMGWIRRVEGDGTLGFDGVPKSSLARYSRASI